MYVHGIPEQIHSDQGREFNNELMEAICKGLDINHTSTTPYHPQCNAAAERFNRTMIQFLTKAIADSDRSTLDWELYLGPLTLSYNSGVNKSTRMSPFYATFGFDAKLPLWVDDDYSTPALDNADFAHYSSKLRHAQRVAHQTLTNNVQNEHQRVAERNDQKQVTYPSFARHDRVWVKINQKNCPNPKLAEDFEPGIIIERVTDATYIVSRHLRRRKKRATLNISQLLPRHEDHDGDAMFSAPTPVVPQPGTTSDPPPPASPVVPQPGTKTVPPPPASPVVPQPGTKAVRRSPRLQALSHVDALYAKLSMTQQIAHLLPPFARTLPITEAVPFIQMEKLTNDDVINLIYSGWWAFSGGASGAFISQPHSAAEQAILDGTHTPNEQTVMPPEALEPTPRHAAHMPRRATTTPRHAALMPRRAVTPQRAATTPARLYPDLNMDTLPNDSWDMASPTRQDASSHQEDDSFNSCLGSPSQSLASPTAQQHASRTPLALQRLRDFLSPPSQPAASAPSQHTRASVSGPTAHSTPTAKPRRTRRVKEPTATPIRAPSMPRFSISKAFKKKSKQKN